MKQPMQNVRLLFWGGVMALLIWLLSPSIHAGMQANASHFLLPEYEARYTVSWYGIKGGESVHRLKKRPDGIYHFASVTKPYLKVIPLGFIEKTDFQWDSGKIIPLNYYYDIKEGKRHKKGNVLFDWKAKLVSNTVSNEPWAMPIPQEIQDKLTHALKLRLDLTQGQTSNLSYLVAEDDEVKNYTFTLLGKETIQTKIGQLNTIKVEHISRKGYKTITWLDIDRVYLPVKVKHYRKHRLSGTGEIVHYELINPKENS